MIGVLIKMENLDTKTCTEGRLCEETEGALCEGRGLGWCSTAKERQGLPATTRRRAVWNRFFLRASRMNQPC